MKHLGYAYRITFVDDAGENPDSFILVCRFEGGMSRVGALAEEGAKSCSDEYALVNSIEYLGEALAPSNNAVHLTPAADALSATSDTEPQAQVTADR